MKHWHMIHAANAGLNEYPCTAAGFHAGKHNVCVLNYFVLFIKPYQLYVTYGKVSKLTQRMLPSHTQYVYLYRDIVLFCVA